MLLYQGEGWEPEAVLNWLALVGWGNRSGDAEHVKLQRGQSVPDIFTLDDLTSKVWPLVTLTKYTLRLILL